MAFAEMGNYSDLAAQDVERADRSRQRDVVMQAGSDAPKATWNLQLSGNDAVRLTQHNGQGDLTYRFSQNGPQLQSAFSKAPASENLQDYTHQSVLYRVWNLSCGLAAHAPSEGDIELLSKYSAEAGELYRASQSMNQQYCMPHIGMRLASLR